EPVMRRKPGTWRSNRGAEGSPDWIPSRVQQDVALALVLGSRLREAPTRGPRAALEPEEAVRARRRREDRDGARREQAEDRHLHLSTGHHHRPEGDGGRQVEAGDPEKDQPRSVHQYPGDPEARAGRTAHLRVGGDAAREARGVP